MNRLNYNTISPAKTKEDTVLKPNEISRPSDVKIGQRYKVVEGYHAGKGGTVVGKEESSFGYVWYKIHDDDTGENVSVRWSDLESL